MGLLRIIMFAWQQNDSKDFLPASEHLKDAIAATVANHESSRAWIVSEKTTRSRNAIKQYRSSIRSGLGH